MRLRALFLLTLVITMVAGLAGPRQALAFHQGSLAEEFESAASEYNVPHELLLAMGYVNTRWEMPSEPSMDMGWGIMHLVKNGTTDTLGEASRSTGLPEWVLKGSRPSNIRGGAALLSKAQGPERPSDLNGWYEAVSRLGGGALYANQVFETLQKGAAATISTGEQVVLAAQQGVAPRSTYAAQATADYTPASWIPAYAGNYTLANRPSSNPVSRIIIHMTQGSYASTIGWFQDPRARATTEYVIRSSDGDITQMVHEKDIAWHAGNWSYNQTSIGIEHEGFVDNPNWFTDAMYRSSATLVAHLCRKYNIPIDREHIIGHNEVPDPNNPNLYGGVNHHQDPGPHWDWDRYMSLVRAEAGHAARYSQVVDTQTPGYFSASSNWGWSSWNPQRYGAKYRFATTNTAISDPARFRVDIPSTGKYAVYVRWPAHPGYNSSTPIGIQTTSGLRWMQVDQTTNGGDWVYLGTYNMSAGDGWRILFSRWSYSPGYIIADAVKIVAQD